MKGHLHKLVDSIPAGCVVDNEVYVGQVVKFDQNANISQNLDKLEHACQEA